MGKKRGNKRNANPLSLGSNEGATSASSAPIPNKESDKKEELPEKSDIGENKSEKLHLLL